MRIARRLLPPLLSLYAATSPHAGDAYADFRVPEYRLLAWRVSGFTNLDGFRQADSDTDERDRSGNYSLSTRLYGETESEAWAGWFAFTPQASLSTRNRRTRERLSEEQTDSRTWRERVSLQGELDRYAGGDGWFAGLGVDLLPEFLRTTSTTEFRLPLSFPPPDEFRSRDERRSEQNQLRATLTARVGHGRLRDVSGVYIWTVGERRLRESGRLVHEPSPEAKRRLAQLYYASSGFSIVHDRGARALWREIERILREDGALEGGVLDAWTVQRLQEPTAALRVARSRGVRVNAIAQLDMTRGHDNSEVHRVAQYISADTVQSESRLDVSGGNRRFHNDEAGGFEVMAGWPLGERWQLDFSNQSTYGSGSKRMYRLRTEAAATWILGERWASRLSLQHAFTSQRNDAGRPAPDWNLGSVLELHYFVEDAWSVALRLQEQQLANHSGSQPFFIVNPPYFTRDRQLSLSLNWSPLGWFRIPGLGIAEQRTPRVD